MYNKRAVGAIAEKKVSEYLEKKGMEILIQNYHTPYGEIDIIGKSEDTYIFVEVKFRTTSKYGPGREAVGEEKQRRYYDSAMHYVQENDLGDIKMRFDVAEVNGSQMAIEHIINAF